MFSVARGEKWNNRSCIIEVNVITYCGWLSLCTVIFVNLIFNTLFSKYSTNRNMFNCRHWNINVCIKLMFLFIKINSLFLRRLFFTLIFALLKAGTIIFKLLCFVLWQRLKGLIWFLICNTHWRDIPLGN